MKLLFIFISCSWPPVLDSALDQMRMDAIHLYGVEHMSTKDIFAYFDLFGPDTLEWVDDFSCKLLELIFFVRKTFAHI